PNHRGAFESNFTPSTDGCLNYLDIGAPVASYCTWRGIEVWDIDHSSGAATPVIVTSVPDLQQLAQVSGFDDLLTLLPDGSARVVAADLYGGVYRFSFDPAVCLARLQSTQAARSGRANGACSGRRHFLLLRPLAFFREL